MDGINKMLTDKGILLDDTKFEHVSVFQNDGVTCNTLSICRCPP
jgi:phosphoribosylaminoimidazole-succinocarboxamide synthase